MNETSSSITLKAVQLALERLRFFLPAIKYEGFCSVFHETESMSNNLRMVQISTLSKTFYSG